MDILDLFRINSLVEVCGIGPGKTYGIAASPVILTVEPLSATGPAPLGATAASPPTPNGTQPKAAYMRPLPNQTICPLRYR